MTVQVFLRRGSLRRRQTTRSRNLAPEEKSEIDSEQFARTTVFDDKRFRPPYICTAAFANDVHEARNLQNVLGASFDVNGETWDGFAPIHIAAIFGHIEFVKYLLAHSSVRHNKTDQKGYTALMLAVENKRTEVVKLLLDSPFIDVNMHNKCGRNALGLAVVNSDYPEDEIGLFLTLLENERLDCNSSCGKEGNVIKLVRHRGWPLQLVKEIELNCAIITADSLNDDLWEAARKGDVSKIEHLLYVRKLDVNVIDRNSNTALILSCIYGQADVIEVLLKHPLLAVNLKNRFGNTALAMATYKGFARVVKLLLTNPDLNPNLANEEGRNTALHLAIREQCFAVAKLIIDCPRTNVNVKNEKGETPYQQADRLGMQHVATYLSKLPTAQVNSREEDFLEACRMGYEERVHYMLTRQLTDPNTKDGEGNTGLHEAIVYKQYGVMAHLLSCPNLNQKAFNRSRETPLSLAKKLKDEYALQLFLSFKKEKLPRERTGKMLLSHTDEILEVLAENGLHLEQAPQIEDATNLFTTAFALVESLDTLVVYLSDEVFRDPRNCAVLLAAYRRHARLVPIAKSASEVLTSAEGNLGLKKMVLDLETLDVLAQVGVTESHLRAAINYLLCEKLYVVQPSAYSSILSQQVTTLKDTLAAS